MTEASYEIRDDREPVEIVLIGDVDRPLVESLHAAIEAWHPKSEKPATMVDLSAVGAFETDARDALAAMNRTLVGKVGRHVYLARTARLRGLSLWVLHMSTDVEGRTVGTEKQARTWLGGETGRLESHFRQAGIDIIPPRAKQGVPPKLSFAERVGATAIGWISRITFGYWPAFTRELVRTYGLDGVKQWGEAVEGAMGGLSERFGEETAQLIIAMAAVWNGCSYCTTGHLYALNILYFKRTGRLFPIDEREVPRWYTMTDDRLVERIIERLGDAEFAEMVPLLKRQYQIRTEGDEIASSEEDELIVKANAAWDLVNECSIVIETSQIPPLHPGAARARGVQKAYAKKRGREATK